MMQADITEGFVCFCAAPVQLHRPDSCQLRLFVIRHVSRRWVTVPEGCLGSREGLLPAAGGMQHNLSDLPE